MTRVQVNSEFGTLQDWDWIESTEEGAAWLGAEFWAKIRALFQFNVRVVVEDTSDSSD